MQALSAALAAKGTSLAAGARGMSVAGGMPLSWKWRKKLVGWITITISGCDGDVAEETEILLPLDCLPASEMGLIQAIDSTTCSLSGRDTYLTRTRHPSFKTYSIWSSWFVLASEVLPLLEFMAMGHVLAAAGH